MDALVKRIEDIEDFSEIEEIEQRVFTDPFPKEVYITDFLHHPYSEYYKLVYNDKIIGYFGLWVIYTDVQITTIAVDQNYQGKGLGDTMMNYLIEYVKGKKCSVITLEVRVSNTVAIKYYEKYGFKIVAKRKFYYENGEDAYLMELTI